MALFILAIVLLATFASNSAKPTDALPYAESYRAVAKMSETLTVEVLSMAAKLPHLNDYRRHYAEIVHVIYHMSNMTAHNCTQLQLPDAYDVLVDEAASEAISTPSRVIETTDKLLNGLNSKTSAIQRLVNISCANGVNARDCNEVLQNFILNDPDRYKKEAEILLLAGGSAKAFNTYANKFIYISNEIEAHKYVITGPTELIYVVDPFATLLQILFPNDKPC